MATEKWCVLDYGTTAHWWNGKDGTACGRDFVIDVREARTRHTKCGKCFAAVKEGNLDGHR